MEPTDHGLSSWRDSHPSQGRGQHMCEWMFIVPDLLRCYAEFKLLDFRDCPQSTPQPITLTMSPRTSNTFHLKPLKFTSQDNDTSLPCPSERASLPGGSFRPFPLCPPSGQLTSQLLPDLSSHHPLLLLLTSHTIPQPTIRNTQPIMSFLSLKPSHCSLVAQGVGPLD